MIRIKKKINVTEWNHTTRAFRSFRGSRDPLSFYFFSFFFLKRRNRPFSIFDSARRPGEKGATVSVRNKRSDVLFYCVDGVARRIVRQDLRGRFSDSHGFRIPGPFERRFSRVSFRVFIFVLGFFFSPYRVRLPVGSGGDPYRIRFTCLFKRHPPTPSSGRAARRRGLGVCFVFFFSKRSA